MLERSRHDRSRSTSGFPAAIEARSRLASHARGRWFEPSRAHDAYVVLTRAFRCRLRWKQRRLGVREAFSGAQWCLITGRVCSLRAS
jgi:hypothetical protein